MKKSLLSLLAIAFTVSFTAKAAHVSGGEVNYQHISGNQYKIILNLFWDCSVFDPGTSQVMTANSSCGLTIPSFTVNIDSTVDVSSFCSSTSTTCNGGALPGMKKNIYSALVNLPGTCSDWRFEHTNCCRSTSINLSSTPSYDFYAILNNAINSGNNSAYFNENISLFLRVGQTESFYFNATDVDANALTYSFVSAMSTDYITSAPYNLSYTGAAPITGITIDANTGLITVTPTTIGNFVVAIMATERDANGVVIGNVVRDFIVNVISSANQAVLGSSGSITNLVGSSAVLVNPISVTFCSGTNLSFDLVYSDLDAADVLSATTNIAAALPGASISVSGSNPLTLSISWNPPFNYITPVSVLNVAVTDNSCPIPGYKMFSYYFYKNNATYAGPDQTICGNQQAMLHASAGSTYNWSVVSGPPMQVGVNFSCTTCQDAIATPSATTMYMLVETGAGLCNYTDTVTVNVVNGFTHTVTQSSTNACLFVPVQLDVTNTIPSGSYTYQWSPATYLSNANIANPTATFTGAGTFDYLLTTSNAAGCVITDSISIVAHPVVIPTTTVSNDTTICLGGSANLAVNITNAINPICGVVSTSGCGANSMTSQVGTGITSNSSYSFPAPFGNFYSSGSSQYIYTAAELNAVGITSGKIDNLAFNVTQISGISTYHNFTIKMGCTTSQGFSSSTPAFVQGTSTVFPSQTITITTGWNTFNFPNPYIWDGFSNIVVEVCFNEIVSGSNYTSNSSTELSSTSFVSSIVSSSDMQAQCGNPNGYFNTQSERPNIKFGYCPYFDISIYTTQWSPVSGNILNSNSLSTSATPNFPTNYTVTVSDIYGACSTQNTVYVMVENPPLSFTMIPDSTNAYNFWAYNPPVSPNMSYHWDFGDGTTSSLTSPTHLYTTAGTYNVCLSTASVNCPDTLCHSLTISGVLNSCQALYGLFPDVNSSTPNSYTCYNFSYGNLTSYLWDFGDGTTSTLATPSHVYPSNGPYLLCLTVSDGISCTNTYCDTIVDVDSLNRSINPLHINVVDGPPFGSHLATLVNKVENDKTIEVVPNPFSDFTTFNFKSTEPRNYSIEVYDLCGKKIKQFTNITSARFQMNSEDMSKGMYFYQITQGEKEFAKGKLLVQ